MSEEIVDPRSPQGPSDSCIHNFVGEDRACDDCGLVFPELDGARPLVVGAGGRPREALVTVADALRHPRTWMLLPMSSRRRCSCCTRRATHAGLANGCAMTVGCEWRVRQWVRDPLWRLRRQ